ncbi:MAG: ABC transporter ATP-binding protein [Gammaproteobacteria bacterium]|nr:ABC transporter ATP-binding protein [Gammaproteobacteria bacterium]
MSKISIRNIARYTLNGVDLDVVDGEILTLLGSSGSGKSTLLRLIAGIDRPDRGSIEIDGEVMTGDGTFVLPEHRKVGVVFQNYSLFPHLSVKENILFGLKDRHSSQADDRYQELEIIFGLQDLARRFPHQISGGQQQRVAVARAMAPQPSILLFDEPFSNLDEYLRENVRRDIRQILKENGLTAVFVSHDKKDALSISDRIAILNEGVVEQVDSPEMMYTCPKSAYIAEYFGKTNLIQASATEKGFDTPFGFLPHQHAEDQGAAGLLSIRPHWCVVDKEQPFIKGKVDHIVDYGECKEVTLCTEQKQQIFIHLHHHEPVQPGHEIGVHVDAPRLKILEK